MKDNHTKFVLIGSAITTIISALVFIFFFRAIQNKNEHTLVLMNTLADRMAQKENAQILKQKFDEVSSIKDTIDGYFVDPKDINFINSIESLGSSFGADVKVESFDIPQNSKNTLSVKISSSGSFVNMMRLLVLVENMPYKLNITRAYLDKSEVDTPVTTDQKVKVAKAPTTLSWILEVSFNVLTSS